MVSISTESKGHGRGNGGVPVFRSIEVSDVVDNSGMFETGCDGGIGNTAVLDYFGDWMDAFDGAETGMTECCGHLEVD